ncbi:MAG: TetR/AcrR family transcriptional regulator [Chitinophagales bacterium]
MIEIKKNKRSKSFIAIQKSAKTLFWKYGITRVTVEEICQEAGVSKMTFYRNFKNKNEVAKQVLIHLSEKGLADYNRIMVQDIAFIDKVRQMILMKAENSKDVSHEFLKDIYQNQDTSLQEILIKHRKKSLDRVMEDFAEAQKKGWIRQDLKLSFILYTLNDLQKKILDEELAALYANSTEMIMELTTSFFYGILPTKTHKL